MASPVDGHALDFPQGQGAHSSSLWTALTPRKDKSLLFGSER